MGISKRLQLGVLMMMIMMMLSCKNSWANPSFYVTGPTSLNTGDPGDYYIRLDTDGVTDINSVQAVLNIPTAFFNVPSSIPQSVGTTNPNLVDENQNQIQCMSTPLPVVVAPTPTLPPPSSGSATPYYAGGKLVIVCAKTAQNPFADNAYIAHIRLIASSPTSPSTALTFATGYQLMYKGIGQSVTQASPTGLTITIGGAALPTSTPTPTGPTTTPTFTPTPTPTGATATPTPTNTPTITPTPTNTGTPTPTGSPTPTTSSSSSSSSGDYALSASDINFVTIAPAPSPTPATDEPLEFVEPDNTVPSPPVITPRPPATPFPTPDPNAEDADGQVLAVQSIRDLLIPGKSQADKQVVLFNFISLLSLLSVIAVIIWRLIMLKRSNKLKQDHIAELVSGELAALETKLSVLNEKDGKDTFKLEFDEVMQHINDELVASQKIKKD